MSIAIGSRARWNGRAVVVTEPAAWAGPGRYRVWWRAGRSSSTAIVHESALEEVTLPTFAEGDAVHVGSNRRRGTVTELVHDGDRTLYRVQYPDEVRKGVLDPGRNALVGPESINL